ncbi:hypothetical protein FRACA_1150003 [Frankia canadensis]|uniref:Uncharacterized protein n=1 Tax=Frankia canadensis TaxID=1836972 RepID=A0A2I2KJK3_9ACTN|nr:hypothetical protein FRACA_1150003 [Frankia canadensis]SOU53139.1 hypothetical protein FRACA_1150003 [Frankia canadensis]
MRFTNIFPARYSDAGHSLTDGWTAAERRLNNSEQPGIRHSDTPDSSGCRPPAAASR